MREILIGLGLITAGGCSKTTSDPAPSRPVTGAPVAFVATEVRPGSPSSIDVKAYNFADKPLAHYMVLVRYQDAAGKALKVREGTWLEKDFQFTSLTGKQVRCEPKSWCRLTFVELDVPPQAARADILPLLVSALDDAGALEDKELYRLDPSPVVGTDWPENMGTTPAAAGDRAR